MQLLLLLLIPIGFCVWRAIESKMKRKCKGCKRKLEFDDIVDVEDAGSSVRSLGSYVSAYQRLRVTCQCPQCGTEKTLEVKFKVADADETMLGNTRVESYDLKEKLFEWFQK